MRHLYVVEDNVRSMVAFRTHQEALAKVTPLEVPNITPIEAAPSYVPPIHESMVKRFGHRILSAATYADKLAPTTPVTYLHGSAPTDIA